MRHLITLLLLAIGLQAAPWSPATVDNFTPFLMRGLVAYWKLDEASGTRFDSWTNAIHLTDNNTVASIAGKLNLGGDFVTNNSEYLSVSDPASMVNGANMTCSFWTSNDNYVSLQTFVTKWTYQTDGEFAIATFQETNVICNIASTANDAGANYVVFTNAIRSGEMSHVAIVFDGSKTGNTNRLVAYRNGNRLAAGGTGTVPATIRNGGADFNIGKFGGTLTRYADGLIDEVAIWNKSLSSNDVLFLYNLGKARRFPFNSGP